MHVYNIGPFEVLHDDARPVIGIFQIGGTTLEGNLIQNEYTPANHVKATGGTPYSGNWGSTNVRLGPMTLEGVESPINEWWFVWFNVGQELEPPSAWTWEHSTATSLTFDATQALTGLQYRSTLIVPEPTSVMLAVCVLCVVLTMFGSRVVGKFLNGWRTK